jgi:hypothetical protein
LTFNWLSREGTCLMATTIFMLIRKTFENQRAVRAAEAE